jgi:nicotinamidase-related amidase
VIPARPFGYPYDGRLDPAATALLVIDMQTDFLSPNGYFALKGYDPAPLRAIIPAVQALVAAMRQAGGLIVWTRQGYRADQADLTPYERFRNRRAGVEIVPELAPRTGEPIVDKTANGAFYATDLDHVLRWRGITHLIFTGCTTDVCVHTTLREANDRNYQCLLVEDACASGDAYAHAAAVHMVTVEGGIFGCVANAADTVAGLEAAAP